MRKKNLYKGIVILDNKIHFWIKQIREFDRKFHHPPKKYKITEYDMKKHEDGTCEMSYSCAGKGGSMILKGSFEYCISMMNSMLQLGYYTKEDDKTNKTHD